ncbi:hypothetical protein RF11_14191 [Thelohanellus kitauei]|uniref:Uncharacterized protein n=1 Tax=Thelohanellus kitauei TaxID=669202 RepID=A0A0C2J7J2_THEKT|nr:hypothetical protein RF11_14191 [Thelohanellus kitauei]
MQHLPGISRKCPKKRTISINNNKSELTIVLKQRLKWRCMKFVITQIKRCIYGSKGFEINIYFFLLSFRGHNCATIYYQSIRRHFAVQLQLALHRSDGTQNTQPVNP